MQTASMTHRRHADTFLTHTRRRRPGWTGTTGPLSSSAAFPLSILYDNDKCLVSRILPDGTRQRMRY